MFDIDGENDLFVHLTDALRSGPGSQAWSQAVLRVKSGQGTEQDKLLLMVRQRLEEGKAFRAVEPSPRLTSAVMAAVAAEAAAEADRPSMPMPRRSTSPRLLVALTAVAALVVFAVAGTVMSAMLDGGGLRSPTSVFLPHKAVVANLEGSIQPFTAIPNGWKPIGALRVKADKGLRLAKGPKQIDQAGGLLRSEPFAAGQPIGLEATIRYVGGADASPEIFLTDDSALDDESPAQREHELAWTVLDGRPNLRLSDHAVVLDGQPIGPGEQALLAVKIKITGKSATVETSVGGKKGNSWFGPHHLATDKPWHMGVRFVVHGQRHDECVAVDTICVNSHK